METIKGKLLVSTRSQAAGRKTVLRMISVIGIAFGLFVLFFLTTNLDLFRSMGRDMFSDETLGIIVPAILAFVFLGYGVFNLFMSHFGFKSYCDVYENMVVGTTSMSWNNPRAPMRNFEIPYSEIVSVSESRQTLYIQTRYDKYEVLALKNLAEASKEIRARMTGNR